MTFISNGNRWLKKNFEKEISLSVKDDNFPMVAFCILYDMFQTAVSVSGTFSKSSKAQHVFTAICSQSTILVLAFAYCC